MSEEFKITVKGTGVTHDDDLVITVDAAPPPQIGITLELFLLVSGVRAWVDVGAVGQINDDAGITTARTATQQGTIFSYDGGRMGATLDNDDGSAQWSSANLAGPWVVSGMSLLDEGLPARLSVLPPGGTTPVRIFTGLVNVWPVTYDGYTSTVVVSAVDGQDQLNGSDLAPLQVPIGAGDGSGFRINRILERPGWDATNDDIDETPWSTLQATTFSDNPWSDIQTTQESDGAFTWINPLNGVTHRLRSWPIGQTPAVTFSNLTESGTVEYYNPKPSAARKTNVVKLTRDGGMTQTGQTRDAAPGNYRSYTHGGLICETDRQVMDLALYQAGWFGHKQPFEFGQVTVDLLPTTDLAIWQTVLGLDLFDVFEIHHMTEDNQTIVRQGLIQGVSGVFRQHIVTVTLDLAPAPPGVNTSKYDDGVTKYDNHAPYGFAMAA